MLAGMLLPALNSVKRKATMLTCLNQMKQIGVAMLMYANDNDDRVPPHRPTIASYLITGGYTGVPHIAAFNYSSNDWGIKNVSNTVFDNPGLYICPEAYAKGLQAAPGADYTQTNYGVTCVVSGQNTKYCYAVQGNGSTLKYSTGKKLREIQGNILLGEVDYSATLTPNGGTKYRVGKGEENYYQPPVYTWSLREDRMFSGLVHEGKSSNWLFKDGHVSNYKYGGSGMIDDKFTL